MKRKLKTISLLLAVVISISLLAGCTGSSAESGLYVDGKKVSVDNMLTIGDEKIPFDVFRYFYLYFKGNFDNGDKEYWTKNPDMAKTLSEMVVDNIKFMSKTKVMAKEMDIKLDETDQKQIKDQVDKVKSSYKTDGEYKDAMLAANLTEESYQWIMENQLLYNKVFEKYYDKAGANDITTDMFKTIMNSEYVRVKHVLLTEKDSAGKDQKPLADEILAKAKSGENFDELIKTYNTDPGMKDNADGYYFTKGEMVKEFEDTSFGLKIGDVDIAKSSYGYHVIKRLEFEQKYIDANIEKMLSAYKEKKLYSLIMEKPGDVTYHEQYKNVSPQNLK